MTTETVAADSRFKRLASVAEDSGIRLRIGLIVLASDEIGEDAFKRQMPPSVRVFTTRAAIDGAEHAQGGFTILDGMDGALRNLPRSERVELIAFSCTSGTVASGRDRLLEQLSAARPGLLYTSPAIGAIEAMRGLGLRRIALITPYRPRLHSLFPTFFRNAGFDVVADGTFDVGTDAEVGMISAASIFEAARAMTRRAAPDGIFISCTAFNVVPILPQLNREIGVPVLASSQVMAWHALKLGGLDAEARAIGIKC